MRAEKWRDDLGRKPRDGLVTGWIGDEMDWRWNGLAMEWICDFATTAILEQKEYQ